MKRNFLKLLCSIISLLMLSTLLLVGCGDNKQETDKSVDDKSSDENVSKITEETKVKEKVKLTFWHNYGADKETPYFNEVILPMFEKKYPEIELEVIAQGNDQYKDQIIISAGTRTTPDLARLDLMDVSGLAKIGALSSLDNLEGFTELKDKILENPLNTNLYQGKYYGVPLDTNCKAAVLNMNVMKQMGFKDVPKTMEEYVEASKKNNPNKYTISVSSTGDWDFIPYFWLYGGILTDDAYTKASGYLDSEQSIEALNKLVQLHKDGILTIKEIDGTTDAWDGIKSGEYGMFFEGPWFFTFNDTWKDEGLKPALIPTKDGKTMSVVGGENISIFSTCKHPQEAFTFIEFLLSEEVQTLMGTEMGQMPVLKSATDNENLNQNELFKVYLEQLQTAKTRIPSPQTTAIQEHLKDAFDAVMRGETETKIALTEAAQLIDEELAK